MKRAFLVGIDSYPERPLDGCVSDATRFAHLLVDRFGFAYRDIRLLTDSRATKVAILERLGWLLHKLSSGERALFYFSGHGIQIATRNPTGVARELEEAICPVDFKLPGSNAITDKEFFKIFEDVPKFASCVWISDSCNSGGLSMPTKENLQRKTYGLPVDLDWRVKTAKSNGARPMGLAHSAGRPNVAFISACKSTQMAGQAIIRGHARGVLTYSLINELEKRHARKLPLDKLVERVTNEVRSLGYHQTPQLRGSIKIKGRPFLASQA